MFTMIVASLLLNKTREEEDGGSGIWDIHHRPMHAARKRLGFSRRSNIGASDNYYYYWTIV